MSNKPQNPYRPGSIVWSIYEGDWEDLTITQIAEVLGCSRTTVRGYIQRIQRETGYAVPHVPRKAGRPKGS